MLKPETLTECNRSDNYPRQWAPVDYPQVNFNPTLYTDLSEMLFSKMASVFIEKYIQRCFIKKAHLRIDGILSLCS